MIKKRDGESAPSQANHRSRSIRSAFMRLNSQSTRTWLTPVLTLLLLLGIVAGAIIVSTLTRAHVQLDNGTVWVTSLKDRKAARFNVKLSQADGGVSSSDATFDVAQHSDDTVLTGGTKAQSILASTLGVHGKSEIKGSTSTLVGGDTTAFINEKTGNVWVGASNNLDSIAPTTANPQMRLGAGGKIAVTHDGAVYGYRPDDGMVLKIDDAQSAAHELGSVTDGRHVNAESFTVIGNRPVVASKGEIMWNGGGAKVDARGTLVLQAPPTDDAQQGWVAASAKNALFTVDFKHGGKTSEFATHGTADPAQPVSSKGCLHAAWSQAAHNYIRVCSASGAQEAESDEPAQFQSLQSVLPTSQLTFRTNHRLVVLNDVTNGNVWNPDQSTKVIKIQWRQIRTKKIVSKQHESDSANNQTQFKPNCSAKSGAIKAEDDSFGSRVGSEQILDVLRNDEQTDCSVLHISKIGPVSGGGITVAPIYAGRYLQLDTTGAKPGKTSFTYEINDGRGQTSQATVTLNLAGSGTNQAPAQVDTPPEYSVEQGANFTVNALGSFADPEGDPMTLVSAAPQNDSQVAVSTRADGQLVFNTGSLAGGRVGIELTVSDGQATGTGVIYFSVRPTNTLPALIDPVTRTTAPDTSTTVKLKQFVHGTSAQPATLSSVSAPAGTSTSTNATDLSFTFKASDPGTYYVPYVISQGSIEAQGLARIEVQPVTDQSARPVAANDVALIGADRTAIVEPLENDTDPMGGVLSITSVNADPRLGIKTGLVAHKRVYMTARQIPTRPVTVSYTVANASGSTRGTIVLQPPALTSTNAAPKAGNVEANVRTGGIVSVDALDHVSHADGTTVKLQNDLQYNKKTFKGLAFVSGDDVRYQASDTPGVYPITYTVRDNVGNAASGTITVTVHAKDGATKAPPTPQDVQAQVAAGQKVRIPITLTGIDPDGDDDTLLGLGNKAPRLGRIEEVGANYIVYEAYNDSAGTDTFSYAVEDWTGQRAQAQIRVGVFKGTSDSGVYARDDQVTLRPNTEATVPVAQNDISSDNTDLKISSELETQGINGAHVQDNMVHFKTPSQPGTAYVIYTVQDKAGLTDTATLTVVTDTNAPIEPPTAYDYRVPSAATIDKKSVDVDLSQWIANPSGTTQELRLGIDPSAQNHAHVKGGKDSTTVSVELTDEARSVPYTVTNTTYHITSTAFVQVPAYGVFAPTLRPKAPPIKVNAKRSVTINIADYVRVGAGKTAYVEKDSVSATKSADSDCFVNDQTLKFTAPRDYAGPASITFTATDAKRNDRVDKNGSKQAKIINSAVLTLPITVIGRNVPPPIFSAPTINVAAGEGAKTIDLKALTHAPGDLDADEMDYTYSGGEVSGPVTTHLTAGGKLTVEAATDAAVGSVTSIPISIKYSNGAVSAGLTAQVTQSTRPLAQVQPVHKQIKAGSSETVDILDGAFNPFPGKTLTVTDCKADDSVKLKVECGRSGSITIRAGEGIGASSNTVVVNIQDATKTRERQVSGTITLSVIDRPAAPLLAPYSSIKPQDGMITLSWTPGTANGSPITDYQVDYGSGNKSCGAVTTCDIGGLTNGKTYTFTVKAKNEVGWSKASNSVNGMPDKVPPAPNDVKVKAGYHTVTVSWGMPQYDGTPVRDFRISTNGGNYVSTGSTAGSRTYTLSDDEINDGSSFSASVEAENGAGVGSPSSSASDVPWGNPDRPGLSLKQDDDDHMTATVTKPSNMRNAGCASITLSGDVTGNLSCPDGGPRQFDIPEAKYGGTVEVNVTFTPNKSGSVPSSDHASLAVRYSVPEPTNVNLTGPDANGICTLKWNGQGRHDGFEVDGRAYGKGTSHWDYQIGPWQSCGARTVKQKHKTNLSNGVTVSDSNVFKKPAEISSSITVQWQDHNHVALSGGGVENWGIGKIQLHLWSGSQERTYDWQPTGAYDVQDLPDTGPYMWQVTVKGDDPAINATGQKNNVQGARGPSALGLSPFSLPFDIPVRSFHDALHASTTATDIRTKAPRTERSTYHHNHQPPLWETAKENL